MGIIDTKTVTREQLVETAHRLVESYEHLDHTEIDGTTFGQALIQHAQHTSKVALGGWRVNDCGCLVGSLRITHGLTAIPSILDEYDQFIIGVHFEEFLLGEEVADLSYEGIVVTVVDPDEDGLCGVV